MNRSGIRGFSLIELMLSLVLGLIVTAVMIASFNSSSKSARTQNALLRILDNGRYASQYMSDELRLVGQQYCSTFANINAITKNGVTPRSPLLVNVNVASKLPKWLPAPPAGTTPYEVDPGVYIRGYDCVASTCTPALPTSANDVNVVPAIGTASGQRAANTDVLTVRYLQGDGVTIAASLPPTSTAPVSLPSAVTSAPLSFANGDLAMIADCNSSQVFATTPAGSTLTHTTADGNYIATLSGFTPYLHNGDSRVFNFTKNMVSVTYFVGFHDDPDDSSRKISALMRITNGAAPEVVVDGVERLDFTYGTIDANGTMHYLNAAQVDANAFGTGACPPLVTSTPPAPTAGCLWRGVSSVEVSMLVNSVQDSDEAAEPFRYSPDGSSYQSLAATATLPNGLKAGRMKRREFRFFANMHSVGR